MNKKTIMISFIFISLSSLLLIIGLLHNNNKSKLSPNNVNASFENSTEKPIGTNIPVTIEKIPFLTFNSSKINNQKNKYLFEAKLSYWNIAQRKIDFQEKSFYKCKGNLPNPPIFWNEDKIILPIESEILNSNITDLKINKNKLGSGFAGNNIVLKPKNQVTSNDENIQKIYILKAYFKDRIIQKETTFEFGKNFCETPSYIDFNHNTGEILIIFPDDPIVVKNFFVVKFNINNISSKKYFEIPINPEYGCGGNDLPVVGSCAFIDNTLYYNSFHSLLATNIENKITQEMDEILEQIKNVKLYSEVGGKIEKIKINKINSYKNILILKLYIYNEEGTKENCICAFQNNNLIGTILKKSNNVWKVYDSKFSEASKIDMNGKSDNIVNLDMFFPSQNSISNDIEKY